MTSYSPTEINLTELQLAILEVLWDRGEASVLEIHDRLRSSRRIAQSTVATLLARLEKKGIVGRREEGRHHLYRSVVEPEDVQRYVAEDSARKIQHASLGDRAMMISYLLDAVRLDDDELTRARELLEEMQRERARTGDSG